MNLGNDSFEMVNTKMRGIYRLWPSNYGRLMTALFNVPDYGTKMVLWQVKSTADELTLTALGWID